MKDSGQSHQTGLRAKGDRWISEEELSEIVGRASQTLRNDRHKRKGIPYSKLGSSVRYRYSDVIAYMESKRVVLEG